MIKITKKYKLKIFFYFFNEIIWVINLFAKSIFDVLLMWCSLLFVSNNQSSFCAKKPNPWPYISIGFANK